MESNFDSAESPLTAAFDALMKKSMEEWHVPGMSIAVVHGEKTFAKFPNEEVMPETLFYAASTTKSFTSAAISLLIDDDAAAKRSAASHHTSEPLTWKSRLCSLIPADFVLPDPYATSRVTFEDSLCHRTGMPDHEKCFGPRSTTVAETVRSLRHLPMTSELREDFMYNNIMYSAVSHALETRTGKNMGVFLRDRIWSPLNMTQSFWTLQDAMAAEATGSVKLARGYAWDAADEGYVATALPDFPSVSGSGAIISNVLDYAKWLRCMMIQSSPISAAGHAAIIEPRIIIPNPKTDAYPKPSAYALRWFVDSYRGENIIWHTGGWTGFGSSCYGHGMTGPEARPLVAREACQTNQVDHVTGSRDGSFGSSGSWKDHEDPEDLFSMKVLYNR